MPYINFHNLTKDQILLISKDILHDISKIADCPSDWFYFNGNDGFSIINNEVRTDVCYVKIDWFKREGKVMHEIASLIDKSLKKLGFVETQITFNELEKSKFFEDGKCYE